MNAVRVHGQVLNSRKGALQRSVTQWMGGGEGKVPALRYSNTWQCKRYAMDAGGGKKIQILALRKGMRHIG